MFDINFQRFPSIEGRARVRWDKKSFFKNLMINDNTNDEIHIFVTDDIRTEIQNENPTLDTNFLKTLNAAFSVNNDLFLLLFDNPSVLTLYTNAGAVTNFDLGAPSLTITQQ